MSLFAHESCRSRAMLAGNMPARAGRMPALPGNEGAIILVTPNRFAIGEREHVARSSRRGVGLRDPLALTAICVDVRCACDA
jgi:hypothetical protein